MKYNGGRNGGRNEGRNEGRNGGRRPCAPTSFAIKNCTS